MSDNKYPGNAFDPEMFKKTANMLVDLLADHLKNVAQPPVLPSLNPEESFKELNFTDKLNDQFDIDTFFKKTIGLSQHLHHPGYIGHQVSTPLPLAAICDFLCTFLNNNGGYYEMGPIHVILEKIIVDWMNRKIGFSNHAGGFLTSGGSLANLTAMLAARQMKSDRDIWNTGYGTEKKFAFLMSNHAHYCIKRAVQVMGLGSQGAILVDTDKHYRMQKNALIAAFNKAHSQGLTPICVVGSACNTGPGVYDNLNDIADFCETNNLWFHIDGAHGASALISEKYKSLLAGISRADSVVWDLHKMLMMPSLATGVLFKRESDSYEAIKYESPYLFNKSEHADYDWKNPVKRSMECTKNSISLKMYVCLNTYGEDFFAEHIDHTFGLAKDFSEMIKDDRNFELAVEPQTNIVCFRYLPNQVSLDLTNANKLQAHIKKMIVASGKYYIVETTLDHKLFLRISIMNPRTQIEDLKKLLVLAKEYGESYSSQKPLL